MFLIQPCCTQKLIPELRRKIGEGGTTLIHGYGDMSLSELLPVLLTRYTDVELMIVAPAVPDAAARVIAQVMDRMLPVTGGGQVPLIRRLTLIANLRKNSRYVSAGWLKENPWGERLEAHHVQQNDTAILLPDMGIVGAVNLSYNGHFTAMATRRARTIAQLRETYLSLCP